MSMEYNHKGIEIIFFKPDKYFYTFYSSPVGHLESDSYKDIVKQIDAKLEEKGLKHIPNHSPTREYINELVSKYAGGGKTYENVTFDNCTFNTPKGYDKLSAEQKTLIDNIIKKLNEKK